MVSGGLFQGTSKKEIICIICKKNKGRYHILEGNVCESCMPHKLIGKKNLCNEDILEYQKEENVDPDTENQKIYDRSSEKRLTPEILESRRSIAFTGYDGIKLSDEINRQIQTADGIDIAVSFIRMAGLNLLYDDLMRFSKTKHLRIITTTYMGYTELESLMSLLNLSNTEIKVEFIAEKSRLHAKTFIFNRSNGTSTAFIGSANITKSALTYGEEWVVRLDERDVPEVIEDIRIGFSDLWNSETFKTIDKKSRAELKQALNK
jgi:HKD family nuclease